MQLNPADFNRDHLLELLRPQEDARSLLKRVYAEPVRCGVPLLDRAHACRRGNVVLIAGQPQSGKTLLCMLACIGFVLPVTWKGVALGGLNSSALFVDADARFDFIQFLDLLIARLRELLPDSLQGEAVPDSDLVQDTLRRFQLCVVDSSKELCAALAISTPKQTPADADSAPTLVVIDSVGAFYALDRAASLVPASPKMPTFGGDAALFQGTNVCAPAPPTASTLQEVHRALTGSVRALARRSVVALVTMSCATHLEDSGMVQYRPLLPKVWEDLATHKVVLATDLLDASRRLWGCWHAPMLNTPAEWIPA